jgi:hypothetical protein
MYKYKCHRIAIELKECREARSRKPNTSRPQYTYIHKGL